MKTRLISAACMLPFIIFLVLGKLPLIIISFLVSCFAVYEFTKGFKNLEIKLSLPVAMAFILVLYAMIYVFIVYSKNWAVFESFMDTWLFAIIAVSLGLIVFDKDHNILGPTYTLVAILYIGFMIAHLSLIELRVHKMVYLPIIVAYLSDAGGYIGGLYFGKHRLAPILSPKKTVEGAVCGLIAGTVGSLIFALIAARENIIFCLIIGILGSLLAEVGDLVASAFKRKMGLKDYSSVIPGHGGILDRIDSVIFVAPFVYYCLVLFDI